MQTLPVPFVRQKTLRNQKGNFWIKKPAKKVFTWAFRVWALEVDDRQNLFKFLNFFPEFDFWNSHEKLNPTHSGEKKRKYFTIKGKKLPFSTSHTAHFLCGFPLLPTASTILFPFFGRRPRQRRNRKVWKKFLSFELNRWKIFFFFAPYFLAEEHLDGFALPSFLWVKKMPEKKENENFKFQNLNLMVGSLRNRARGTSKFTVSWPVDNYKHYSYSIVKLLNYSKKLY